jgi:hypothetical protein
MFARRDGTFEIPDVVPGAYAVTIYAGDRTIERPVDVVAPRTDLDASSGRDAVR